MADAIAPSSKDPAKPQQDYISRADRTIAHANRQAYPTLPLSLLATPSPLPLTPPFPTASSPQPPASTPRS